MASPMISCSVLPSIRLREAAVVNLGSNAVANTLPAGAGSALGAASDPTADLPVREWPCSARRWARMLARLVRRS